MMIKPELVKRIKEYFNLNIYETKVWIALLSKGIASAGEIASLSNVPRSRTYDVLESLEKRGFAIVKIGKPVKYIAVKPVDVLEKMKAGALLDAQDRVKNLSSVKETVEYETLEKLHKAGISPINAHEITGSFKGRQSVLSKIREIVQGAKKEILIATSIGDFEDKSRVLVPAIQEAVQNKIKVHLALDGQISKLKKINAKQNIKISEASTGAKLFIADRKEVFFMITPENSEEEVGVWLNSAFFAQSLASMLETHLEDKKHQ